MGKELPWFKFKCDNWITGNITLCEMEAQGLFTNVCAFYWKKKCCMPLVNAKERFSKYEANFKELLDRKIIKVDNNEDIVIEFLDENPKIRDLNKKITRDEGYKKSIKKERKE